MNKELVIFTCTIKPQVSPRHFKRYSTVSRLSDYQNSLPRNIKQIVGPNRDIIIVENSSFLSMLMDEISRSFPIQVGLGMIRFLEAPLDSRSLFEGISGGEMEMLLNVRNLVKLEKYEFVWKISGRNTIWNLKNLLTIKHDAQIIAERTFTPRHSVNSRVFGMTPKLWSEFLDKTVTFSRASKKTKNYESMEHYLTMFVTNKEFQGVKQNAFSVLPIFSGNSGSIDKELNNFKRKVMILLTNPIRRLVIKFLLGISP